MQGLGGTYHGLHQRIPISGADHSEISVKVPSSLLGWTLTALVASLGTTHNALFFSRTNDETESLQRVT